MPQVVSRRVTRVTEAALFFFLLVSKIQKRGWRDSWFLIPNFCEPSVAVSGWFIYRCIYGQKSKYFTLCHKTNGQADNSLSVFDCCFFFNVTLRLFLLSRSTNKSVTSKFNCCITCSAPLPSYLTSVWVYRAHVPITPHCWLRSRLFLSHNYFLLGSSLSCCGFYFYLPHAFLLIFLQILHLSDLTSHSYWFPFNPLTLERGKNKHHQEKLVLPLRYFKWVCPVCVTSLELILRHMSVCKTSCKKPLKKQKLIHS